MIDPENPKLEVLILQLFNTYAELNIHLISDALKISVDSPAGRKSIQRALKNLLTQQQIEAHGKARARSYRPSQTIKSIGYNQEFLKSYVPNKTHYLSGKLCNELLSIGKTENRIHPAGTYTRDILSRFLIDLSWNSSRLEGNTYSLLETKRLIERGESSAGKDATEAQMILNHKRAIEYLVDTAEDARLGSLEICSIHALLSENLLGDPGASGRLRQLTVGISGTSYSPIDNPYILKELFQQFIEKFNLIKNPFEQSFFSLVHLSYLQAFEDVNKRTSRLVANFPLIRANLIPLSFTDVNEQSYVKALLDIYEKNDIGLLQDLYVQAYKMSAQKYSASQQPMNETQIFKLKYRAVIQDIIRAIIIDNATTSDIVGKIRQLVAAQKLSDADNAEMFNVIETEIVSLHEGNIARFKIRPSEFHLWKKQHPNF